MDDAILTVIVPLLSEVELDGQVLINLNLREVNTSGIYKQTANIPLSRGEYVDNFLRTVKSLLHLIVQAFVVNFLVLK